MDGAVVEGYGDPQPDGAGATVLALLAIVSDPAAALDAARPYLEFLVDGGCLRPGFDLWELTVGQSFHAVNLARRALRRAADTAALAGDPASTRYREAANQHAVALRGFVDPVGGHLVHVFDPHPSWFAATSRLDASVLGSVLLDYDDHDEVRSVDDPALGRTVRLLEDDSAVRWPVNVAWRAAGNLGGGIGRFPEDCNDGLGSTGGNPWPVATLWAAQWHAHRGDRALAEGYLSFVLAHCDATSISEQVDGFTGRPRGVPLLAWSHAELITTLLALGGKSWR